MTVLDRLRRNMLLVLALTIIHFFFYLGIFGSAVAVGDSGRQISTQLSVPLLALGTPLMFLLYLPPSTFGPRWWGDDTNFIIMLAAANALLWGLGATVLIRAWQHRRTTKA